MMERINSMAELTLRINTLQQKEREQRAAFKEHAAGLLKGIKPASVVGSAISRIAASRTFQQSAIDTSIGVGAGWLVRKIYEANTSGFFKKLAAPLLQSLTTGFLTRKIPAIRQKLSSKGF